MATQRYSIHKAVDPKHIAAVMEHSERINRKFDENEIGHTLRDAAIAYLQSYQGTFPFMRTMQAKYRQYGRLYAGQYAKVLNCFVKDVTTELQQAVREVKCVRRTRIVFSQQEDTHVQDSDLG